MIDQSGEPFRFRPDQGAKLLLLRGLDLLGELPVQFPPPPGGTQEDAPAVDLVDVPAGQNLGDQVVGDPGGRGPRQAQLLAESRHGQRAANREQCRHPPLVHGQPVFVNHGVGTSIHQDRGPAQQQRVQPATGTLWVHVASLFPSFTHLPFIRESSIRKRT